MYTGSSIVDYLKSIGQPSDYASRTTLAASKGIAGYVGSASQNIQLLNLLRGGGASTTPTASPSQPSPQPQPTATQQPTQATGTTPEGIPISQLPPDLVFNGQLDISNPDKQTKYNQIVQQYRQGGQAPTSGISGISGLFNAPTINLPELYEGLFASSGIKDIEADLSAKSKAYAEAVSKIKDNPYLSEATMTGRLSKLAERFNADTANIRSDIATRRADIETRFNIQAKQFDINSQQATQAFNQFQTLLSSGALDSVTGEDIANITRATGLSSSMINAAIKAQKDKSVQTSIIQWDDGTNQGFSVINSNTGEIIKTETVAASKPKAASATDQKTADLQQTQQNAIADIQAGSTLRDIINHYTIAGGLSVEDVYRLYNSYSPYGAAKESIEKVKEGKFEA